jgi:ABC-type uncharacterized transport system auxiliary subunit
MNPRFLIRGPSFIGAALLFLVLLGCGLEKPYPAISAFDLSPASTPIPTLGQVRPKVVRVSQFNPSATYETRKLIYKTTKGLLVEDFYNELVAPPSRLLADSVATYLNQRSPSAQFVRTQGQKGADYVLEGFLSECLGDFSQNPPIARLTISVTLNDIRRDKVKIVLAKTYQSQIAFTSNLDRPAPELIAALTKAWGQILANLDADLESVLAKKP